MNRRHTANGAVTLRFPICHEQVVTTRTMVNLMNPFLEDYTNFKTQFPYLLFGNNNSLFAVMNTGNNSLTAKADLKPL